MFTRNKSHARSSPISESIGTNGHKYLPEKCRICLDDGEIPIFGVNDISDDVTEFGKIEISKDDNLPQYICDACYKLLVSAILFRKTAKQSDELLKRADYLDSVSKESDCKAEDEIYESDCKAEDEIYIKTEYLEFDYTSDLELDYFDRVKHESVSEDNATNYNPTISEADSQESNDCKDFQTHVLHGKQDEDKFINEADNEISMIVVSEKDKQKRDEINHMKLDHGDETTEHNEKPFTKILPHQRECEVCHSIVIKSAYSVHLKEHRDKYKEKINKRYRKVECEFCGKKIGKSYIKQHLKMHGTVEEQAERFIECSICNKSFSARYYKDHYKRVHNKKSHKNKKIIQNVKNTIKESTPPPEFKYNKCPVCDKNVKENEFQLHVEGHAHGGSLKQYICDKCGKVFKNPSTFKVHYLTHGSELKFKCQFCPYRGLHQGLLKIHVRTHTGDYNYKCTECPARFITKSNLSKHLQRHKGLYTFKCEECNKGFYTKRDIDRHINNIHMTAKNHICEVCGKAFAHRDNMLGHQLKVHKRVSMNPKGRMPSYLKAELLHLE